MSSSCRHISKTETRDSITNSSKQAMEDIRVSIMARIRYISRGIYVHAFPFVVFKHPSYISFHKFRSRPSKKGDKEARSQSATSSAMLKQAVILSLLLMASLIAVAFFVYICFSFNGQDSFPTVGSDLNTYLFIRNLSVIFIIRYVCVHLVSPNAERLALFNLNLAALDPVLGRIGVVHTARKVWATVTMRPFKVRWFSTFLSDCLLLSAAYVCYVVYRVLRSESSAWAWICLLLDLYKASIILGYLIYTLEYSPILPRAHQSAFNVLLVFLIAVQLSDFFLFLHDKEGAPVTQRAFGVGAQLFITHSSVMLSAVIGGHHEGNPHVCPDLPWKGLVKLVLVFVPAGLWLAYAMAREQFRVVDHGARQHSWVPTSYPWVLGGLQVVGGVVCLGVCAMYCLRHSRVKYAPPLRLFDRLGLFRLGKLSIVPTTTRRASDASLSPHALRLPEAHGKHGGGGEDGMDFDVTLVVVGVTMSGVYYASMVYANYSLHEWLTMCYWLFALLAPIGLSVLAITLWRYPPARPFAFLFVALCMTLCLLFSTVVAEDCHMSLKDPSCCEYPWLPDGNHRFEEVPPAPQCVGDMSIGDLGLPGSVCTQIMMAPEESGLSERVLPLTFTSPLGRTSGFQIITSLNGTSGLRQINSVFVSNVRDLLIRETCQENEETYMSGPHAHRTPPGCYGSYMYTLPAAVTDQCLFTPQGSNCLVSIQAANCAFVESAPLFVVPVDADVYLGGTATEDWTQGGSAQESASFSLFQLVGMACSVEMFFTLVGLLLKIVFLSECQSSLATHAILKHHRERTSAHTEETAAPPPTTPARAATEPSDSHQPTPERTASL